MDIFSFDTKTYKAKSVQLLHSGAEYFDVLEECIEAAQESIHIQIYIFQLDKTGLRVYEALLRASKRNVKIRLLIDGYGSANFPEEWEANLVNNGAKFRRFSPVLNTTFVEIGRRLHQKIVLIDNQIVLIGGINFSDNYSGEGFGTPWLDYAVKIKGSCVSVISEYANQYWVKSYTGLRKENYRPRKDENINVKLKSNDWLRGRAQISSSYRNAIKEAKVKIDIVNAYFLPGKRIRNALKKASENGVRVRVILAIQSDVKLILWATKYLYRWMLRSGIEIYEWKDSVIHAKIASFDSKWITIGSYNLNHLSDYASIEFNVDVENEGFAQIVDTEFEKLIESSDKIEFSTFKEPRRWDRFRSFLAYHLFKVLLRFASVRRRIKAI